MAIERVKLLKPIEFDHKMRRSIAGLIVQAIVNGRATTSPFEQKFSTLVVVKNRNGERNRVFANAQNGRIITIEVTDQPFHYSKHRILSVLPDEPEFIYALPSNQDQPYGNSSVKAVLFDRETSIIGAMLRRLED